MEQEEVFVREKLERKWKKFTSVTRAFGIYVLYKRYWFGEAFFVLMTFLLFDLDLC
jgi:hypothetical protein